ncbi:MAG: hypothetical protein HY296_00435 [Thaumarchaeota archaeon]|nr:hypothetical protein [Nitrososphaerota archaeon]
MIPDVSFDTTTAMLRFQSVIDLRRHLKKMLEDNLKELDKVGNITAMVMRDESIDVSEPSVKGWVKTGTVFVNKSDPEKATLDVLFAMVREIRPKVVKITESRMGWVRNARHKSPAGGRQCEEILDPGVP